MAISPFVWIPGLRQLFGSNAQIERDLATDTFTIRYTAGNTILSRRFTAEELADMSYPGPHAYPGFPGSACSTGMAWGMPATMSRYTVLAYPGYQSAVSNWQIRQAEYEQLMGSSLAGPAQTQPMGSGYEAMFDAYYRAARAVPPSPTVQLHDSPNLKWLRGRVDEIRVPLENL